MVYEATYMHQQLTFSLQLHLNLIPAKYVNYPTIIVFCAPPQQSNFKLSKMQFLTVICIL